MACAWVASALGQKKPGEHAADVAVELPGAKQ